jgi:hypothetical protein
VAPARPAPTPAPARPALAPARVPVPPEPAPKATRPPGLEIAPQPGAIENLLERADAHPRLRPQVARVRELLDQLREGLVAQAEITVAEERVARAAADLKAAEDALREMTRPKARTAPAQPGDEPPRPADVRAWAAEHGVSCSTHGRVPQEVVDQYLAARSAA